MDHEWQETLPAETLLSSSAVQHFCPFLHCARHRFREEGWGKPVNSREFTSAVSTFSVVNNLTLTSSRTITSKPAVVAVFSSPKVSLSLRDQIRQGTKPKGTPAFGYVWYSTSTSVLASPKAKTSCFLNFTCSLFCSGLSGWVPLRHVRATPGRGR